MPLKCVNTRLDAGAASTNHSADEDFVSAGAFVHAAAMHRHKRQDRRDGRERLDGKNTALILARPALPAYPARPALPAYPARPALMSCLSAACPADRLRQGYGESRRSGAKAEAGRYN